MCGIIGYTGPKDAAPLLLNGLRKMEYRGYDSAGTATLHHAHVHLKKDTGKIEEVHAKHNLLDLPGTIGIAHTRWATHGGVTPANAHPHTSCREEVTIVHNGIIENHDALRNTLLNQGHRFRSDTDSEVIAHLLEKHYRRSRNHTEAVLQTVRQLKGAFAFLALFNDKDSTIVGARKDAPLVIGRGAGENFIASDILAFIEHTDRVIFLDNLEVAEVNHRNIKIYSFDGDKIAKPTTQVAWEASDIAKAEFAHYTIKEIHEQPQTIRTALYQDEAKLDDAINAIRKAQKIYITAAGTSYHAGLVAKYLLARFARLPVETVIASEFNHYSELLDSGALVVAISQSGETADVLEAVRRAKAAGAHVLSIVNVMGSSLVRESDRSLYINCGPEIGVAATKSFTAQLALLYLLTLRMAGLTREASELKQLTQGVEKVLRTEPQVRAISERYREKPDFYFVGRGIHYPLALEGALKLKELAYIHAEGMPAGELKHGTLALIEEGTPAIALNPQDDTYDETLSNASEMKARGAQIIGVSNTPHPTYTLHIPLPTVHRLLYPLLEIIPLQMLAYYTALERKQNPDYPRNLAKSVTVK